MCSYLEESSFISEALVSEDTGVPVGDAWQEVEFYTSNHLNNVNLTLKECCSYCCLVVYVVAGA